MYKILTKGQKNYDVIALQQLINIIGKRYNIAILVDGYFGQVTESTLMILQESMGLEPTGICDIITWQSLYTKSEINILKLKSFIYAGMSHDQYYTEHQRKDIIVLHHNADNENPYKQRDHFQEHKNRIGTSYIIGGEGIHDGLILQIFEHPSQWAYHLNIWGNFNVYEGRKEENKKHETRMAKRTIGVELCNYGYLSYKNGEYWFMSKGKKVKAISPENVIDYGEKGYRGKRYYHKYTNKQIETLKDFILKASKYYGINIDKPEGGFCKKWFDYSWDATRGEKNLMSHSNVRSRSDMHPQPELIEMLNSL